MLWLKLKMAIASSVLLLLFAPLAIAQQPDRVPLNLMRGSWAETYGKCVEPIVVKVTEGKLTFVKRTGPDQVESLTKIEGNKVFSKSESDGSENVYEVVKDKITARDSLGNTSSVVRCWNESGSFDRRKACAQAIEKYGSSDKLFNRTKARFNELGLSPYITLKSLSQDDGCAFNFTFLKDAYRLLVLSSIECESLYLNAVRPAYRLPIDETLSLNYEVLNSRRPHDGRFESCFEEKNGMSIWDKVIVVLSSEFKIPLKAISLEAPLSDCSNFRVWYERGAARFREVGCTAGISAPRLLTVAAPQVASAAVSDATSESIDIEVLEKRFLQLFSAFNGSSIAVLERDDDHITFVVRGLRNLVVVGSNYWEKLTVNVFIWRNFSTVYGEGDRVQRGFHSVSETKPWGVKQALKIRVILEGAYSAGSGSYPKDEFFTQNMEPDFHSQLTEFANLLAKKLSEDVQRSSP